MTQEWGPPLTGEQMKALRAAGLQVCSHRVISPMLWGWHGDLRSGCDRHFLPDNHPAYTLIEAGWLDGRNVRLWFGGDKAPEDWEEYSEVLLGNGGIINTMGVHSYGWRNAIIAYIAKAEVVDMRTERMERQRQEQAATLANESETVTIAKPARAERFWKGKERHSLYRDEAARALIDAALEFER